MERHLPPFRFGEFGVTIARLEAECMRDDLKESENLDLDPLQDELDVMLGASESADVTVSNQHTPDLLRYYVTCSEHLEGPASERHLAYAWLLLGRCSALGIMPKEYDIYKGLDDDPTA